MSVIAEGKKAPAFTLQDKDGVKHSLSKVEAEWVVLYFYPKDNTPGCTIEAKSFSSELKKFEKLNALPIGISGGDNTSKQKFCSKHSLRSLLLSDPDFSIAKKYGVYGPKQFMGKKFDGISRVTFILDAKRKVVKVFDKVKPAEHVAEVLAYLKAQA
jgi:peroxiredoxin Q/BCP